METMTERKIYSEADLAAAKAQKKRMLIVFLSATFVYVAASAVILVFHILEPFDAPAPKRTVRLVAECVISAVYITLAFVFISIRYARVRRYCKFLSSVLVRVPTEGIASFMRFNSDVTVKEGVDFKSMTLVEWSDKQNDYLERYVYLDLEKPLPPFKAGDEVRLKTYANVLVAYDILNRTDLTDTPFSE